MTATATRMPPIVPAANRQGAPLPYQQEARWQSEQSGAIGYRTSDGRLVSNTHAAVRVVGTLDRAALQHSFDQAVIRHEALRTRFAAHGGVVTQWPMVPRPVRIEPVDLTRLPVSSRTSAARAIVQAMMLDPFDLRAGLLLRGAAIRLADDDHLVIALIPHIVSDAWSLRVLVDDIVATLQRWAGGNREPIPELAIQYGDFALWQREWLHGQAAAAVEGFYERRLAIASRDRASGARLPRDVTERACDEYHFELPPRLGAAVWALARTKRATPFMVLLAAYGVVLSRWGGESDVRLLQSFSGRSHPQVAPLIGFFTNTCPLRIEVRRDASLAEVVTQAREAVFDAHDFEGVPYRYLSTIAECRGEVLAPIRFGMNSLSGLQQVTSAPLAHAPAGPRCARVDLGVQMADAERLNRSELSLWIKKATADRLAGMLIYQKAVCSARQARQFVADLQDVLDCAGADPRRSIINTAAAS